MFPVVEMGHAKQKMGKQDVLKMWISALHFKTLFLSVKVENIYSMSSAGSWGGAREIQPSPLIFRSKFEARTLSSKKIFFQTGPPSFLRIWITDPPPPIPPNLSEGLDVCSDIRRSCLNCTPSNVPPLVRVYYKC